MSAPLRLKKPKVEMDTAAVEGLEITPWNGGDDGGSNGSGGTTTSREEQEEALMALMEHRIKEVELCRKRVLYYNSQLEIAEKRLQDTESQLVRLRRERNVASSGNAIENETKEVKVDNQSGGSTETIQVSCKILPQTRPELLIPAVKHRISHLIKLEDCGDTRNAIDIGTNEVKVDSQSSGSSETIEGSSKSLLRRRELLIPAVKHKISHLIKLEDSGTKGLIASKHPINSNGKREKAQKVQEFVKKQDNSSKKKKLEEKENKDLIPLIRRRSSPRLIHCQTSTHISSQHKRKMRNLILCPVNDQLFVTSALDGVVNLWQLQGKGSGASLLSATACLSPKQRRWPEDVAWYPQGDRLFFTYSAGGDYQISIMDLKETGDEKGRVTFLEEKPHSKGIINKISFLPLETTCFVTGGSDHAVILWSEQDGDNSWKAKELHKNLHTSAVMGVAGMQQKQIVISAGSDKRIFGFDLVEEKIEFKHQIESKCMSVLPNPCDFNLFMVQTATPERQLKLYDIRLKQTEVHECGWKQESSESQSALINQAWSPDGLYITSGSADPIIHIFDIRHNTRKPSQSLKAHQKRVFKSLWHPSLPLLISISSDLNIGLHNID